MDREKTIQQIVTLKECSDQDIENTKKVIGI